MTKKHNLRFRILTASVIVLAFSCVTATAGTFVYEAVPFQLMDPDTPDEPYTISGAITTDCNNCEANIVDWEISVDGPFPHTFTPLNSTVGTDAIFPDTVLATPSEIFLRDAFDPLGGPFTFVIIESPLSPPNALVFWAVDPTNPPTGFISYGDPIGSADAFLAGLPLDGDGRFVIGTFIPEPSSAVLLVLALSCLSWLRQS